MLCQIDVCCASWHGSLSWLLVHVTDASPVARWQAHCLPLKSTPQAALRAAPHRARRARRLLPASASASHRAASCGRGWRATSSGLPASCGAAQVGMRPCWREQELHKTEQRERLGAGVFELWSPPERSACAPADSSAAPAHLFALRRPALPLALLPPLQCLARLGPRQAGRTSCACATRWSSSPPAACPARTGTQRTLSPPRCACCACQVRPAATRHLAGTRRPVGAD